MRLDHLLSKDKRKHVWVLFSFERSCGALAQLGERLLCTQEVSGSIPLFSTIFEITQMLFNLPMLKVNKFNTILQDLLKL